MLVDAKGRPRLEAIARGLVRLCVRRGGIGCRGTIANRICDFARILYKTFLRRSQEIGYKSSATRSDVHKSDELVVLRDDTPHGQTGTDTDAQKCRYASRVLCSQSQSLSSLSLSLQPLPPCACALVRTRPLRANSACTRAACQHPPRSARPQMWRCERSRGAAAARAAPLACALSRALPA